MSIRLEPAALLGCFPVNLAFQVVVDGLAPNSWSINGRKLSQGPRVTASDSGISLPRRIEVAELAFLAIC